MKKTSKITTKNTRKNKNLIKKTHNEQSQASDFKHYEFPEDQIFNKDLPLLLGEILLEHLNNNILKPVFGKNIVAKHVNSKKETKDYGYYEIALKMKSKIAGFDKSEIEKIQKRLDGLTINVSRFANVIISDEPVDFKKKKYNNNILLTVINTGFGISKAKKIKKDDEAEIHKVPGIVLDFKPRIDRKAKIADIDTKTINEQFDKLTKIFLPMLINIYHIKDDDLLYKTIEEMYF